MRPFVVTDETKAMVDSNIAHLLNGFLACSEFENVIFCWVLHEQHILNNLVNALNLNGCTTHYFSLVSTISPADAAHYRAHGVRAVAGAGEPAADEHVTARMSRIFSQSGERRPGV
jgi:hypothetical protein